MGAARLIRVMTVFVLAIGACGDPVAAPDASTCPAPLAVCSDGCTNTMVDSRHCGDCGTSCAAGEVCNGAGSCELSCQAGLVDCDGTCIDPNTDRAHCGAGADCSTTPGTTCLDGEVCDGAGSCELSCQSGLVDCEGTCIDPDTNRVHCGAGLDCFTDSGVACLEGEVCDGAGSCELSCQSGLVDCDGTCLDPDTDRAHCGAGLDCETTPGTACLDGEVCDGAGNCELSCQAGLLDCDGTCTNVVIDPEHCSDCETNCPERPNAATVCTSGDCAFVCNPDRRDCDGLVINGCESDSLTDDANCGLCGNACPGGLACNNGLCPGGLDFDGVDDTLASQAPLGLGLTTAVTAEYWIYPHSRAWMKLLNIHNASNRDVDMELRPDGLVYCTLFDQSGANHGSTSTSQIALNAWTHVACSYDGTTQRMFVNGAMEAQTAWVGQLQLSDAVTISGFESRFIDGVLDEFRLSSSARYTAAFTPPVHFTDDASTLVLWTLDEGAGAVSADGSGNGFTAQLGASSAAPTWTSVVRP